MPDRASERKKGLFHVKQVFRPAQVQSVSRETCCVWGSLPDAEPGEDVTQNILDINTADQPLKGKPSGA